MTSHVGPLAVMQIPLFCVLTHAHVTCTYFLRLSLDESNLVITNVNRGDEGNYTCVIKTELEQKSVSARLMVMGMTCFKKKHITSDT